MVGGMSIPCCTPYLSTYPTSQHTWYRNDEFEGPYLNQCLKSSVPKSRYRSFGIVRVLYRERVVGVSSLSAGPSFMCHIHF